MSIGHGTGTRRSPPTPWGYDVPNNKVFGKWRGFLNAQALGILNPIRGWELGQALQFGWINRVKFTAGG